MAIKYDPSFANTPEGRKGPGHELLKQIYTAHTSTPDSVGSRDKSNQDVQKALTQDLSDLLFVGPNIPKSIEDQFSTTRKVVGDYEQSMGVPLTDEQYQRVIGSERVKYLIELGIVTFEQKDGQWSFKLYGDPSNDLDDADHWIDHSPNIRILPSATSVLDEVMRILREKQR